MCTSNVDMAMKVLSKSGKISKSGTFKDGTYFELNDDERTLVNDISEEICLSTMFLSLYSDRIHGASRQELKNDLVKGDDKYPRTISNTINFLQHHSLRNRDTHHPDRDWNRPEAAFAQEGEEIKKKVIQMCRAFTEGTCKYKKKHTWKECPSNVWGSNKDKEFDINGVLIL